MVCISHLLTGRLKYLTQFELQWEVFWTWPKFPSGQMWHGCIARLSRGRSPLELGWHSRLEGPRPQYKVASSPSQRHPHLLTDFGNVAHYPFVLKKHYLTVCPILTREHCISTAQVHKWWLLMEKVGLNSGLGVQITVHWELEQPERVPSKVKSFCIRGAGVHC